MGLLNSLRNRKIRREKEDEKTFLREEKLRILQKAVEYEEALKRVVFEQGIGRVSGDRVVIRRNRRNRNSTNIALEDALPIVKEYDSNEDEFHQLQEEFIALQRKYDISDPRERAGLQPCSNSKDEKDPWANLRRAV